MNGSLTPELEKFISTKVESREFRDRKLCAELPKEEAFLANGVIFFSKLSIANGIN
jgi:hypothetical protein